ncbi:MAG: tetratricopeptide repeat-containing sensor histidine kinase [Bacteroidales bacterium]
MIKRFYKYKFLSAIFLFLLSLEFNAFGQNNTVDSLKNELNNSRGVKKVEVLNELSRNYWEISLDTSLIYAQESLEFAEELNDDRYISDAINRVGNAHYLMGEDEKAISHYNKCLEIREKLDDNTRLIQIYNNLALYYANIGEIEKAKENYLKALNTSKKIPDWEEAGVYNLSLSELYASQNKYDEAIEYLLKAEENYQKSSDTIGLGNVHNHRTYIYRRVSSYDKSLKSALKALDYHKSVDNLNGLVTSYNDIGIIHQRLNNYNKALEYYNQMLEVLEDLEQKQGLAIAYNNIGIVHDELDEHEKALDYYQKAFDFNEESEDEVGMASALNNIGIVFFEIEDYKQALDYLNKSLEISEEIKDTESIANTNNNIGEVLLKQGKYASAKQAIQRGLQLATEEQVKEYIEESYRLLSELYEATNNYKKALDYHKLYEELHDSIFSDEKQNRIQEIQTKYETEQKEEDIELLKRAHELKVKRQKTVIIFSIVGVGLLVIVLLLIYNQFRLKKKNARILQNKNHQLENFNKKLKQSEKSLQSLNATKDKLFSIIAHDLKNPFQALLGFSEVLYKNCNKLDKKSIKEYSKAIHESSQNVYNLLENLLQWSRSQVGNIKLKPNHIAIKDSVDDIINLLYINAEDKGIKIQNLIPAKETAYVDKNVFSSVMRNLLNNAIKFTGDGGKIEVTSKHETSRIRVSVSDTGRGIAQKDIEKLFNIEANLTTKGTSDESGTGLGLILCKELIVKSNGKIWVENQEGEGSTFNIALPVEPGQSISS